MAALAPSAACGTSTCPPVRLIQTKAHPPEEDRFRSGADLKEAGTAVTTAPAEAE